MTATTIAYALAGLIAAGIIFIGARFIVAPRVAAAGYGVQPDLGQRSAGTVGATNSEPLEGLRGDERVTSEPCRLGPREENQEAEPPMTFERGREEAERVLYSSIEISLAQSA